MHALLLREKDKSIYKSKIPALPAQLFAAKPHGPPEGWGGAQKGGEEGKQYLFGLLACFHILQCKCPAPFPV